MLKSVVDLIEGNKKKAGNHRTEYQGDIQKFYYYWTCICEVNHAKKTYKVDNGGYGTPSTTRAINDYKRAFSDLGYEEIA